MAVEGGRVEFGPSFRLAPDLAVEDQCQGWRLRHRRRRRALGRALDGDLCAATECPARGGRPVRSCRRGYRRRVGAGTGRLRVRGQPTGGSAAPGGLPPVGRGRLPRRSRRVPLLPALVRTALSFQLAIPPGDFRVHARDPRPGPGPARRAEGVPLIYVRIVLTTSDNGRCRRLSEEVSAGHAGDTMRWQPARSRQHLFTSAS